MKADQFFGQSFIGNQYVGIAALQGGIRAFRLEQAAGYRNAVFFVLQFVQVDADRSLIHSFVADPAVDVDDPFKDADALFVALEYLLVIFSAADSTTR